MKTTIIVLICLLIGSAIGGVLALGFGAGMGAASGLVLGSQAGICLTAETAREQGLSIEPEAMDKLIAATIAKVRAQSGIMPMEGDVQWMDDSAGCKDIIPQLNGPMIAR